MLGYLKPLSMSDVSPSAITLGIPASEDLLDRSGPDLYSQSRLSFDIISQ